MKIKIDAKIFRAKAYQSGWVNPIKNNFPDKVQEVLYSYLGIDKEQLVELLLESFTLFIDEEKKDCLYH